MCCSRSRASTVQPREGRRRKYRSSWICEKYFTSHQQSLQIGYHIHPILLITWLLALRLLPITQGSDFLAEVLRAELWEDQQPNCLPLSRSFTGGAAEEPLLVIGPVSFLHVLVSCLHHDRPLVIALPRVLRAYRLGHLLPVELQSVHLQVHQALHKLLLLLLAPSQQLSLHQMRAKRLESDHYVMLLGSVLTDFSKFEFKQMWYDANEVFRVQRDSYFRNSQEKQKFDWNFKFEVKFCVNASKRNVETSFKIIIQFFLET